jgi:hypothetical protein
MSTESSLLHLLPATARYFPYVGGGETHVYEVGRRLACAGIEVTIPTTDASGQLPTVEESEGMRIRRVRAWPTNMEAIALQRPVLVANTSALQELANRGFARSVPLESTPEEVAPAMVSQLRQPLVPQNVALPTCDACVSSLLALYHVIARRAPCAS